MLEGELVRGPAHAGLARHPGLSSELFDGRRNPKIALQDRAADGEDPFEAINLAVQVLDGRVVRLQGVCPILAVQGVAFATLLVESALPGVFALVEAMVEPAFDDDVDPHLDVVADVESRRRKRARLNFFQLGLGADESADPRR